MAIEDTKFVKSVEAKKGAKGTYHKVTWVDDKFFNVFDPQILKVCQQGLKENKAINYTTEKDEAGYYRLLTAEVVTADMLPEEVEPVAPPPQIDEPPQEELAPGTVLPAPIIATEKPKLSAKDNADLRLRACSFSLSYAKDQINEGIQSGAMSFDEIATKTKALADSYLDWFKDKLNKWI